VEDRRSTRIEEGPDRGGAARGTELVETNGRASRDVEGIEVVVPGRLDRSGAGLGRVFAHRLPELDLESAGLDGPEPERVGADSVIDVIERAACAVRAALDGQRVETSPIEAHGPLVRERAA